MLKSVGANSVRPSQTSAHRKHHGYVLTSVGVDVLDDPSKHTPTAPTATLILV